MKTWADYDLSRISLMEKTTTRSIFYAFMNVNVIIDLSPDEIYRKMIIDGFKTRAFPFVSK